MIFRLFLILCVIAAAGAAECRTVKFSYNYPNTESNFVWKYYCFEENIIDNTMLLNDQLRGFCKMSNLNECEKSLIDVPYDAIVKEFDGTNWKFTLGLADCGLGATGIGLKLMELGMWDYMYPPLIMMHFPKKDSECELD